MHSCYYFHSFFFRAFRQFCFRSRILPKNVSSELEKALFEIFRLISSIVHIKSDTWNNLQFVGITFLNIGFCKSHHLVEYSTTFNNVHILINFFSPDNWSGMNTKIFKPKIRKFSIKMLYILLNIYILIVEYHSYDVVR